MESFSSNINLNPLITNRYFSLKYNILGVANCDYMQPNKNYRKAIVKQFSEHAASENASRCLKRK